MVQKAQSALPPTPRQRIAAEQRYLVRTRCEIWVGQARVPGALGLRLGVSRSWCGGAREP